MSTIYKFYHRNKKDKKEECIAIFAQTELAAISEAKQYVDLLKPDQWLLEKEVKQVIAKEV